MLIYHPNFAFLRCRTVRLFPVLALIVLHGCIFGGDDDEDVNPGIIRGKVINSQTNQPVSGASVKLSAANNRSSSITTPATGVYSFTEVNIGEYTLEVTHDDYETHTEKITILGGDTHVQDVQFAPLPPILTLSNKSLDFNTNLSKIAFEITNTGKGTLSWQISENISWLDVNPTEGTTADETDVVTVTVDRSELRPSDDGEANKIIVESNAGKEDVDVALKVISQLLITPKDLNFAHDKTTQTFTIENKGTGTLSYNIVTNQDWLSVTPSEGSVSTEADPITVTVDRTGLDFDSYAGKVLINSSDAADQVNVQMIVPDPSAPVLSLSATALNYGSNESVKKLKITNAGSRALTWSVTKTQSWLEISSNSSSGIAPGDSEELTLTINRKELAADKYEDVLKFSSNGGSLDVSIQMEVSGSPVLLVSEEQLDFGRVDTQKAFTISNEGNGDLHWEAKANQDWLEVSPKAGTNQATLNVTVNREGLAYQDYSGQIDISSNSGTKKVVVSMTSAAPNEPPQAKFSLTPQSISVGTEFTADASESADDYDNINDLEVRWRWEANGSFTEWTTAKTATHKYLSSGKKEITLEVKDNDGEISEIKQTINVSELTETEPNNTPENAALVNLNEVVTAKVGFGDDDTDWYKIKASDNGTLQYKVTNTVDSKVTNGNLSNVILYDKEFSEVSKITYSYLYAGRNSESYPVPVNKNEEYFIKIAPYSNIHSATYLLEVSFDKNSITDIGEPNDSENNATILEENSTNEATVGFDIDEVDWYQINLPQNGLFSFEIINKHAYRTINGSMANPRLYDKDRKQVNIYSTYVNPNSTFSIKPITTTENSTYYLKLAPYKKGNRIPYEIKTSFTEQNISDANEPNNSQSAAHSMSENEEIVASIGYGNDEEDWYKLNIPSNGFLSLELVNKHVTDVGFGSIGEPILFDKNLNQVDMYMSYVNPNKSYASRPLAVEADAVYYVRIKPYGKEHKAPYVLKTSFTELTYTDTKEVNNSFSNAASIESSESFSATIGYNDKEDWYKVTMPSSGVFQFSVANEHANNILNGSASIQLLDNQQKKVFNNPYTLAADRTYSSYSVSVEGKSSYYIKVSSYSSRHKAPYTLKTNFVAFTYTDAHEPNNSRDTAHEIKNNESVEATVGYSGDGEDWYKIKMPSDGQFFFTITNQHSKENYLTYANLGKATLFDEKLNEITKINQGYIDAGETSSSSKVVVSGNSYYYIKIIPKNKAHRVPYKLTTEFQN